MNANRNFKSAAILIQFCFSFYRNRRYLRVHQEGRERSQGRRQPQETSPFTEDHPRFLHTARLREQW